MKYYNPSEHLTVDKVTVPFKGGFVFKEYIPKKHKYFSNNILKLCHSTTYNHDIKYTGKPG
jgi:hypothetical protein